MKRILSVLLALCLALTFLPTAALAAEQSGAFTVAAMNVDGLPQKILGFNINADGPGSDGTKAISAAIANRGWDIIGVSEDFNYHTELMSSLSGSYTSGNHRGGVSGLSNNTDGLNLIWKNTLTVTGESWTAWNTHYSTGLLGTGNGADGMIDKGYRYYQAEIAQGVCVDVYILHMDADSDQGDIDARHSQLTQLANAIKASNNRNPIIVMGDTNCRYTRENLKTLFIDAINADARFTIQDAWIEKVRGGSYPAVGDSALVATDKGGTYDYPAAEIVDKVFYINNTESSVTLQANSYTIATDFTNSSGTALADHWPVVVEFTYTLAAEHTHSYTVTDETQATCTEEGSKTYTCECGDSYTESTPALGHDYQVTETAATCTESGSKTYTCTRCGHTYTETINAAGHTFVDGKCSVCGEADPDASTGEQDPASYTLGNATTEVTSGKKYAIVYPSADPYVMSRSGSSINAQRFPTQVGDPVSADLVWTITENAGGYTISAEVSGKTVYLARTKNMTYGGYSVTLQDSPYTWQIKAGDNGRVMISDKVGASRYALRIYSLRYGWIVCARVTNISIYEINE